MKAALHLVAMPLAYPLHPSSQLGYLHGFAKASFGDRLPIRSHHAFLPILYGLAGAEMAQFFEDYSLVGEEILYLACCLSARRHGELDFAPAAEFEDAFLRYNSFRASPLNEAQQQLTPIAMETLVRFCDLLETYVEGRLAPALDHGTLNIIGFTASFCQVFGSIFAARHLKRVTDKRILLIFGGSSYSLPEGSRTLSSWTVDGLTVAGSGEAPLLALIEACLALDSAQEPLDAIDSLGIVNVHRIGAPHSPVDLRMPKRYMESLPDPNYDDYFAELRAICLDDTAYRYACENLASIPLEGSRGCFAKCDFCHNPNITSQFRTLPGEQVAQRALSLTSRYGVPDITFVDSVSNTWAEAYADSLIARGVQLKAFMELRVHAPETFWTKLALCGATTLQLGVEAVSPSLLTSMRKRTTVMQNLAATKYMAELGTRNASNLIIDHPCATLDDVRETKRVIALLEHFPAFNLSRFVVSFASPLYNELPEARKAELSRGFDWLPREFERFGWPRHLSYTWPDGWREPAMVEAWLRFQVWYADHVKRLAARPIAASFTVDRDGDSLLLKDTRFGRNENYRISGLDARVYDACHSPRTEAIAVQMLQAPATDVHASLRALTERQALFETEGHFLSVAFRPQGELVERLQQVCSTLASPAPAHIDGVRRRILDEVSTGIVS